MRRRKRRRREEEVMLQSPSCRLKFKERRDNRHTAGREIAREILEKKR